MAQNVKNMSIQNFMHTKTTGNGKKSQFKLSLLTW